MPNSFIVPDLVRKIFTIVFENVKAQVVSEQAVNADHVFISFCSINITNFSKDTKRDLCVENAVAVHAMLVN